MNESASRDAATARAERARVPARILVVGAGGLGSAAALVLAAHAEHIECLTFVDDDRVEPGNLHRQVLHADAQRGRPKVESAARAMAALAPGLRVETIDERLTADNALDRIAGEHLVLDGSDNFATRFLVNDACMIARVPFVHAAAIRWQGQLLGVDPRRGDPCYRCLFEAPPAPAEGSCDSCAEAGVVGPVVGVLGAMQAEAGLALLAGRLRPGELVTYDGLAGAFRTVRFHRNPACTACGAGAGRILDPAASPPEGHARHATS
jgi:molybdopterin/thiamine biosynthesis adenylyltransferase